MGGINKERQGEFSVRPKRFVELPEDPCTAGCIVLFPKISPDLEEALNDGSSYPAILTCHRSQCGDHPLSMMDRFVWPYRDFNGYFGPVPGYRRADCPTVYLPSQIYRGLQRAVISEVRSRQKV